MTVFTKGDELAAGKSGLPCVTLKAADGATAEIYLHGAQVTSWRPAGGDEQLYLSRAAGFGDGSPIRGGIPVCFPQFSGMGPLPKHGFARSMTWEYMGMRRGHEAAPGAATAAFSLTENDASLAFWPHRFRAGLEMTVGGQELSVTLTVRNTDNEPFTFTAALHTYLRVADLATAHVEGLGGLPYRDAAVGYLDRVQDTAELRFSGEVDRIFFAAPRSVELIEPSRSLSVSASNFPDIVVWNPGPERAAKLADMEPGGYLRMVCIEAAIVGAAVTLEPGQTWEGAQYARANSTAKADAGAGA
jgi:glucose-6-phosphate 1-epimerase